MSSGATKLDSLLSVLGRPGRLQVFCSLFLIYAFMHAIAMNFIMSFATFTPPHRCKLPADWSWPENVSIPHHHHLHHDRGSDSCHVYVDPFNHSLGLATCPNGYDYSHRDGEADRIYVSTEWNLVCDHKYLVRVFQTFYFVGVLMSGIVGGFMCDFFGRRTMWLINEAIYLVAGLTFYFEFGFIASCAFIFILGTAMQGKTQAAISLAIEMFPDRYRTLVGLATFSTPAISFALSTAIAYYLHDWRTQIYLHALLTLVGLPAYWLTPESLRWLVTCRRNRDAVRVCRSFAKMNGISLPPSIERDVCEVINAIQRDLCSTKKQTIIDVLREKTLRKYLFILSYCQFAAQLSLYGFSFIVADLGGDVYVNSAIIAVVDCVMRFSSYSALEKFGRRTMMVFSMFITGGFHLLSVFIRLFAKDSPTLLMTSIVASITARVFNGIFFCSFLIIIAELFPTTVRTTTTGMIGSCGRLGLMCTPLLLLLSDYAGKQLPIIVFGVMTLLCGFLSTMLAETKNLPMPSTIEEAVRGSTKIKDAEQPSTNGRSSSLTEPVKYVMDQELVPLK